MVTVPLRGVPGGFDRNSVGEKDTKNEDALKEYAMPLVTVAVWPGFVMTIELEMLPPGAMV
jgi:hypothetical protein